LAAEASGILNWAIEGFHAWRKTGLRAPEAVKAATEAYRAESDTLREFFEDCCVIDRNRTTDAGELYKGYRRWAEDSGYQRPLTATAFGKALTDRGYPADRARDGRGIGQQHRVEHLTRLVNDVIKRLATMPGVLSNELPATVRSLTMDDFSVHARPTQRRVSAVRETATNAANLAADTLERIAEIARTVAEINARAAGAKLDGVELLSIETPAQIDARALELKQRRCAACG
jgi:phage/plasmid-associated DNA primase